MFFILEFLFREFYSTMQVIRVSLKWRLYLLMKSFICIVPIEELQSGQIGAKLSNVVVPPSRSDLMCPA